MVCIKPVQGQAKPNSGTEKGHTITPLAMEILAIVNTLSLSPSPLFLCEERDRDKESNFSLRMVNLVSVLLFRGIHTSKNLWAALVLKE